LIEVIYIFDRLSVLADRSDLIRWQVPLLDIVICTRYHDSWLIDAPAHTQDRGSRIILEHYLLLDLSAHARLSLVDNQVAIPEGCEEQARTELLIGRVERGEFQARDWLLGIGRQREFGVIRVDVIDLLLLWLLLLHLLAKSRPVHFC
jgi:hypothetical protein